MRTTVRKATRLPLFLSARWSELVSTANISTITMSFAHWKICMDSQRQTIAQASRQLLTVGYHRPHRLQRPRQLHHPVASLTVVLRQATSPAGPRPGQLQSAALPIQALSLVKRDRPRLLVEIAPSARHSWLPPG